MLVNEALRRINFKAGNLDDITGKSINPIIKNRYVIDELNTQLIEYASKTKGIMDIFSFPLDTDTPFIEAPSLALRSQSYYYLIVYSQGTIFPADMRGVSDTYPNFRYNPTRGITNWFLPWHGGLKKYFSMFPMKNVGYLTTNLTKNISATDTTIPVVSTAAYVDNHGRISIGDERILYSYLDSTNFYNCVRGEQMTIPVAHENNSEVKENNVLIFYSRLPEKIIVNDNDTVPKSVLNHEIEIVEEHIQGIIKLVAYELLIKLDPERAMVYKIDGDALFEKYETDIRRGYYRGRQGTGIRQPFPVNESGIPYGTNLIY